MDESQTRLYTSYKLIHIKQCSTYSWSILSKETGQLETAALSSKYGGIHMKRIIPILMTLLLLSGCATQSAEKTYYGGSYYDDGGGNRIHPPRCSYCSGI